jgi:hypothetical protein
MTNMNHNDDKLKDLFSQMSNNRVSPNFEHNVMHRVHTLAKLKKQNQRMQIKLVGIAAGLAFVIFIPLVFVQFKFIQNFESIFTYLKSIVVKESLLLSIQNIFSSKNALGIIIAGAALLISMVINHRKRAV